MTVTFRRGALLCGGLHGCWCGCVLWTMRRWDPLSVRMLDVLRVIAAGGCEDDAGSAMKVEVPPGEPQVSARALEARGLVTVTRRGGWSAEVTDAGRFYLEHGHHPDRPADNGRSGAEAARVLVRNSKQVLPEQRRRSAPAATARVAEDRRAAAAKLVADLVGGSRFVVERPSDESVAEWRKVVDFAKRHDLVLAAIRW